MGGEDSMWKDKLGQNRERADFEDDVATIKRNVETGAKALGEGRSMILILELLLDIKEKLSEIKNKL